MYLIYSLVTFCKEFLVDSCDLFARILEEGFTINGIIVCIPVFVWFVHHFTNDVLKCIFENENRYILIRISLNGGPNCVEKHVLRRKNCTSTSARVQFFQYKIERINRPTRHILLQSRICFLYEQQQHE